MILNITGTSGSGKSYIVRHLMRLGKARPDYPPEAAPNLLGQYGVRPLGYWLDTPSGAAYVMGHYEVPSGGCERLLGSLGWTTEQVFAKIRRQDDAGAHVIYEGVLMGRIGEVLKMHAEGRRILVVHLNVAFEECVAAIEARRAVRGDARPLNLKHTTNKFRETAGQARKLAEAGVAVRSEGRAEALRACVEAFGWTV